MIFKRLCLTSNSEPARPGLKILVESQIIARTPCAPICFNFFSFIVFPIKGLGSHFQSPVCRMVPTGVSILRPLGSKIECVKVINSILKGPNLTVPFKSTIFKLFPISIFFSLNFSFIKTLVNGVA